MYQSTIRNFFRLLACVVVLAPLPPALAGSAKRAIQGDWQLQIDIDGRKMSSVLSLYKDADDGFKGEWISFFGITELREIEYETRELSFVMTLWLGEGDTVTKFAGSVKKGELSGTFSNDRGEYAARGKRIRRIPMAAGTWQSKLKMGDREFTADLVIK
ncbi:MAG: hypothetical protein JSW47_01765, partial [Phycisphaerales bacterium]